MTGVVRGCLVCKGKWSLSHSSLVITSAEPQIASGNPEPRELNVAPVVRFSPCTRNKEDEQDRDDRASPLQSRPHYENGELVSGTESLLTTKTFVSVCSALHCFLSVPFFSREHMTGLHSFCT